MNKPDPRSLWSCRPCRKGSSSHRRECNAPRPHPWRWFVISWKFHIQSNHLPPHHQVSRVSWPLEGKLVNQLNCMSSTSTPRRTRSIRTESGRPESSRRSWFRCCCCCWFCCCCWCRHLRGPRATQRCWSRCWCEPSRRRWRLRHAGATHWQMRKPW